MEPHLVRRRMIITLLKGKLHLIDVLNEVMASSGSLPLFTGHPSLYARRTAAGHAGKEIREGWPQRLKQDPAPFFLFLTFVKGAESLLHSRFIVA